jgi:uncharacterized membrane protein
MQFIHEMPLWGWVLLAVLAVIAIVSLLFAFAIGDAAGGILDGLSQGYIGASIRAEKAKRRERIKNFFKGYGMTITALVVMALVLIYR